MCQINKTNQHIGDGGYRVVNVSFLSRTVEKWHSLQEKTELVHNSNAENRTAVSKEIQRDILDMKILLSGKPSVAERGDKALPHKSDQ